MVEMQIGTVTMKNSMEASQKIKNRVTLWLRSSTAGYISGKSPVIWKDIHAPQFHRSIIYNCQDMEAN